MKQEDLFLISGAGLVDDNVKEKYIHSKANFEKCRADLERAKQLITDKLISQKEFLEANLKYKQAEATFNTIAKNYSDGGEKITSPATGFISNVFVIEGQYVDMGQTLAKIIKNQKMIIKADVPPQHYAKLNRIHSANFITPYNNKTYDIANLNGKLISYGKSTDRSSIYTPVYFEIENILTNTTREERLIPGSFIEIYLKAKPIPEAIIIPYSALIEEYEKYFVFVQKTGESFEKREVKLGGRDGKNVHVLSGIKENERVVTKGAFRIRLVSLSNELQSGGHVH
ncbi:Multidrug resistance protein MdtA [subsurface metagenome]